MPKLLLAFTAIAFSLCAYAIHPFEDQDVSWEHESGDWVTFSGEGTAKLKLAGSLVSSKILSLNGTDISASAGRFVIELDVPEVPVPLEFRIRTPDQDDKVYPIRFIWKKLWNPVQKRKTYRAENWLAVELLESKIPSRFSVAVVEASGLVAADSVGGAVASGGVAWVPEFRWTRSWTVAAGVGAFALKIASTQSIVLGLEYRLGIRRSLLPGFEVEVAAGAQTWMGAAPLVPAGGITLRLARSILLPARSFLDWTPTFLLGYTYTASPDTILHQFRLGVSIPL